MNDPCLQNIDLFDLSTFEDLKCLGDDQLLSVVTPITDESE